MIELNGSQLFQWEINRSLTVAVEGATLVHYGHTGDPDALVVEIDEDQAAIPNVLLQKAGWLNVYAVDTTDDGIEVLESAVFEIIKRPKPETYIYEETPTVSLEKLQQDINDIYHTLETVVSYDSAPVGGETNPIYIDDDGKAHASSTDVGDATNPVYLANGVITQCDDLLEIAASYTDASVESADYLKYQVVDELPEDPDTRVVYAIPATYQADNSDNAYTEYIFIDGAWELWGPQDCDIDPDQILADAKAYANELASDTLTEATNEAATYTDDAIAEAIAVAGNCWWATCDTAGDEAAKIATTTTPGFALKEGVVVVVKFDNALACSNATLNIDDTGDYSMTYVRESESSIVEDDDNNEDTTVSVIDADADTDSDDDTESGTGNLAYVTLPQNAYIANQSVIFVYDNLSWVALNLAMSAESITGKLDLGKWSISETNDDELEVSFSEFEYPSLYFSPKYHQAAFFGQDVQGEGDGCYTVQVNGRQMGEDLGDTGFITRNSSGLGCLYGIGSGGQNHGVWSRGYAPTADTYTADGVWEIYRNSSGQITVGDSSHSLAIPGGVEGSLTCTGSITASGHSTAIGSQLSVTTTSVSSVSSATATSLQSLSLPAGTWIVIATANYTISTDQKICNYISTSVANSNWGNYHYATTSDVRTHAVRPYVASSSTTLYNVAHALSGATVDSANMYAIRIS